MNCFFKNVEKRITLKRSIITKARHFRSTFFKFLVPLIQDSDLPIPSSSVLIENWELKESDVNLTGREGLKKVLAAMGGSSIKNWLSNYTK